MKTVVISLCLVAVAAAHHQQAPQNPEDRAVSVFVDTLDLSKAAIRRPRAGRGQPTPPPPLVFALGGVTYEHAVPLNADADLTIDLGGKAQRFTALVGIDDTVKAPAGSVIFGVWVDGKQVADTGVIRGGDA